MFCIIKWFINSSHHLIFSFIFQFTEIQTYQLQKQPTISKYKIATRRSIVHSIQNTTELSNKMIFTKHMPNVDYSHYLTGNALWFFPLKSMHVITQKKIIFIQIYEKRSMLCRLSEITGLKKCKCNLILFILFIYLLLQYYIAQIINLYFLKDILFSQETGPNKI